VPPELKEVLLLAVMNPGAIVAGFLIGRRADQMQKLVVAGFAGGVAGVLFTGLLMVTGLHAAKVSLLGGVFVGAFVVGVVFGWIGFTSRRDGPGTDGGR
jgi:hypothetical protein